jgi:cell division protein FtsQ
MKEALPMPLDVKLINFTASALLVVFGVMVMGALFNWAASNPAFAIRGIVIVGEVEHNNAVTLRVNVAPKLSGTFFTLDLSAARRAFEAVPWVRKAVVHREFPNRLKVKLEEHKAVAYWEGEGESLLVNSFGEVFEANLGEVEQDFLPTLEGPHGQSAQILEMYQSLKPLFGDKSFTIEKLFQTAHGGWRVMLDSDALIELGNGTVPEVLGRTQRFLKTLTQVTSRYGRQADALESADLRHEDGYAIRLRGVTTLVMDAQK